MPIDTLNREYQGVRNNIMFPGLLETTAKISITCRSQIIRLLQDLAYHCKLEKGFPGVRFGRRDWAKPGENKLSFRDPEAGLDMSVHIVLHEYAHLWADVKKEKPEKRRKSHGPKFRMCLDALLLIWRDKIRANYLEYLKAEEKTNGNH